jgi:hypothetical protein
MYFSNTMPKNRIVFKIHLVIYVSHYTSVFWRALVLLGLAAQAIQGRVFASRSTLRWAKATA